MCDSRTRIVVGLDGAAGSMSTLAWAAREALVRRTHLHLVGCPAEGADDVIGAARRLLDSSFGCLPVDLECLPRTAGAMRALMVAAHNAALVVVSGDAGGVFADAGATPTSPVAVLRRGQVLATAEHGRIVVGVGAGSGARDALSWAAHEVLYRDLIDLSCSTLHVVPVVQSGWGTPPEHPLAYLMDQVLAGPLTSVRISLESPAGDRAGRPRHAGAALLEATRGSDLLVVDRDATQALDDALTSAPAHDRLTRIPCPVVIVPDARAPASIAACLTGLSA